MNSETLGWFGYRYVIGSIVIAVIIFIASVWCHCCRCGRTEGQKIEDLIGQDEQIIYHGGLNSDWDERRFWSISQLPCKVCTACPAPISSAFNNNSEFFCKLYCVSIFAMVFLGPGILLGSLAALIVYIPFSNMRLKERKSFSIAITATNLYVSQTFEGIESYDISMQIPIHTINRLEETGYGTSKCLDVHFKKQLSDQQQHGCLSVVYPEPESYIFTNLTDYDEVKKMIELAQERHQYAQDIQQQLLQQNFSQMYLNNLLNQQQMWQHQHLEQAWVTIPINQQQVKESSISNTENPVNDNDSSTENPINIISVAPKFLKSNL